MQTARYALSSNLFTVCKREGKTQMMVAEMSEIPNWPAMVYTENKKKWIDVKSEKTGKEQPFVFVRNILAPDGEFAGVVFAAWPEGLAHQVELHILND